MHGRWSVAPLARLFVALLLGGHCFPASARAEGEEKLVVQDGKQVSIEYTLTLDDGTKADSNVGGEPLVYTHGGSQILGALESALGGLSVGDTKELSLPPEQGYGTRDPALLQEVDKSMIPADAQVVGMQLVSESPEGQRRLVLVHEVREDKIVLDLNHPLAGQTLHFEVKVLDIE